MRKIKEVLRLRFDLGLTQEQIAGSCNIAQPTVHRYLERATAAGLTWPLPADCDDRRLEELLFPTRPGWEPNVIRPMPDLAGVHQQLQANKHVTLQLLWEEYREHNPAAYGYSRFCQLYQTWRRQQNVILRQEHRAGEKMFVDWAGATIPVHDRDTGECQAVCLFVAVLGGSNYTFAYATPSQALPHWIDCHVRAFEFFSGTPKLVIPDNARTAVDRSCRYEPDLNRTYHEMASHYGVAVLPARPYKPRDKAKVETAVLVAERWIIAALRQRKFFSIAELNEAIAALLDHLNRRPFRKRPGSRISLFEEVDRPALQPLPVKRYEFAQWKTVRANIDYHVEIDRHLYSVPYQLTGQQLEARFTAATVEIFHRGVRVASHVRSYTPYRASTVHEHRPKSHQAHLEWTPSRLIHWAEGVGPATAKVVTTILESKPHPEMGYRACLGILRLAKTYSPQRLEAASQRALLLQACSYNSLKSILSRSLDRQMSIESPPDKPGPKHDNIRGGDYYGQAGPLLQ
jgi:transposase